MKVLQQQDIRRMSGYTVAKDSVYALEMIPVKVVREILGDFLVGVKQARSIGRFIHPTEIIVDFEERFAVLFKEEKK